MFVWHMFNCECFAWLSYPGSGALARAFEVLSVIYDVERVQQTYMYSNGPPCTRRPTPLQSRSQLRWVDLSANAVRGGGDDNVLAAAGTAVGAAALVLRRAA